MINKNFHHKKNNNYKNLKENINDYSIDNDTILAIILITQNYSLVFRYILERILKNICKIPIQNRIKFQNT